MSYLDDIKFYSDEKCTERHYDLDEYESITTFNSELGYYSCVASRLYPGYYEKKFCYKQRGTIIYQYFSDPNC